MLTRVSSFHTYNSVQNDIRSQESKIVHQQGQLASGKRILSASDDPLAAHFVEGIKQQKAEIKQYIDGIGLARNRLETEEILISNAEQHVDQARIIIHEMINGLYDKTDRMAKGTELKELVSSFMSLVNTRDESGNHIFGGNKPKTQPFFKDKNGEVGYAGDQYQRKIKISQTLEIPINDPGNEVFMNVENPYKHYNPSYNLQDRSDLLLESANNTDPSDQSQYRVKFVERDTNEYHYELYKDDIIQKIGVYDPEVGINFESLNIVFKNDIKNGDEVSLSRQEKFDIFGTLARAIRLTENNNVQDLNNTAELHQIAEELNAARVHIDQFRTTVGARLKTLDTLENQHEDMNLALYAARNNFEDLDYSKAVIDFSKNTRALEASQSAFGKVKDLTLFRYI